MSNFSADDSVENVLAQIRQHLHDRHWRSELLSMVGQQKQKNAARAIRAILNAGSEYEKWLHRDLLFAGSCLAENPADLQSADRELCREILQGLVELEGSERSGDRVRDLASQVLCTLKETDYQRQALELLKERDLDEERLLKYRVVLGEEEEAIAQRCGCNIAILVARLEDKDYEVRRRAINALGQFGANSETAVRALVARLEDEDSTVRWKAALALGKLGNSSQTFVSPLLERRSDEDSTVRWSAAIALGNLGKKSRDVLAAVAQWIDSHQDSEYLGNGIDALWDAVVEEGS